MGKVAWIFPGQGAQTVGMGASLIASDEQTAQLAKRANDVLPFDLIELMTKGPQEELTLTYHTQPALLAVGAFVAERLSRASLQPDYVAGHSLGEYTALVASGALSFDEGVRVVYERGRHMDEAVPAGEGAMAAVLGSDRETIERVTSQITAEGHPVQPANMNCPGQIVISGSREGVERAMPALKEEGAKRVLPLQVSGPFHSSLMEPAAEQLRASLDRVTIRTSDVPVVANVNSEPTTEAEQLKEQLVEQLYSPVLWEDSVRRMIDEGVTHFIECGPGKVLAGLIRKIDRSVTVVPAYDEETVERAIELAKEWE
ncbi:MAG TPA: ACP S-malonyltransferase [Savagea sp.]